MIRFLILFLCLQQCALAGEIGLLPQDDEEVESASQEKILLEQKEESQEKLEIPTQEDDFITQEKTRLQNIKLLSLDLEEATLKHKIRDINAKAISIDAKDKEHAKDQVVNEEEGFVLVGIVISGKVAKAVLNVNGKLKEFLQGDAVDRQWVMKTITPKTITLEKSDGTVQSLSIG